MMPRFSPPTAMGLPRNRASAACSTEAKKASASRCTMERGKDTGKFRFLIAESRGETQREQNHDRTESYAAGPRWWSKIAKNFTISLPELSRLERGKIF